MSLFLCLFVDFFFFFKQKTAYEMRISDWSSDVCSSDLTRKPRALIRAIGICNVPRAAIIVVSASRALAINWDRKSITSCGRIRSEEHTSELQSLMRISYAVFCLKKKKK